MQGEAVAGTINLASRLSCAGRAKFASLVSSVKSIADDGKHLAGGVAPKTAAGDPARTMFSELTRLQSEISEMLHAKTTSIDSDNNGRDGFGSGDVDHERRRRETSSFSCTDSVAIGKKYFR
jgi:hypothetical protein